MTREALDALRNYIEKRLGIFVPASREAKAAWEAFAALAAEPEEDGQ